MSVHYSLSKTTGHSTDFWVGEVARAMSSFSEVTQYKEIDEGVECVTLANEQLCVYLYRVVAEEKDDALYLWGMVEDLLGSIRLYHTEGCNTAVEECLLAVAEVFLTIDEDDVVMDLNGTVMMFARHNGQLVMNRDCYRDAELQIDKLKVGYKSIKESEFPAYFTRIKSQLDWKGLEKQLGIDLYPDDYT